jgi:hypothetical protein
MPAGWSSRSQAPRPAPTRTKVSAPRRQWRVPQRSALRRATSTMSAVMGAPPPRGVSCTPEMDPTLPMMAVTGKAPPPDSTKGCRAQGQHARRGSVGTHVECECGYMCHSSKPTVVTQQGQPGLMWTEGGAQVTWDVHECTPN